MLYEILFYLVVFFSNIIQGITGFAGTILAMPFSIRLVGYESARPILNALGLLAGICFAVSGRRHIIKKELIRIVLIMTVGLVTGTFIRTAMEGQKKILMLILGVFVIIVGVKGLITDGEERFHLMARFGKVKNRKQVSGEQRDTRSASVFSFFILVLAGLIHGIFVSGGPLLISYLSQRIKKKENFRATISAVWVFLNGIIFVMDILGGSFIVRTVRMQLVSIPFLFGGLVVGSALYSRMSQRTFRILTDVLLIIAGFALF
ncbi:MAG: TSUP family transporter [Candidatus Weimeria sp.]